MLKVEALRDELVKVSQEVGKHKEVAEKAGISVAYLAQIRQGKNAKTEKDSETGAKRIIWISDHTSSISLLTSLSMIIINYTRCLNLNHYLANSAPTCELQMSFTHFRKGKSL